MFFRTETVRAAWPVRAHTHVCCRIIVEGQDTLAERPERVREVEVIFLWFVRLAVASAHECICAVPLASVTCHRIDTHTHTYAGVAQIRTFCLRLRSQKL